MNILPLGAELFHGDRQRDRQTDRDMINLIFALRNFAERA
jgi:hypothetical protein